LSFIYNKEFIQKRKKKFNFICKKMIWTLREFELCY
jgi:hypothetical protein